MGREPIPASVLLPFARQIGGKVDSGCLQPGHRVNCDTGEKVRFQAAKIDGAFGVTAIEPAQ
ncbi:hypothetical protein [Variovorax paradoxus]|uniref:Uncharacterized protein n=1 Tax=Variovorax paradoxus TaxID=34073 RepID=A0A6I6H959_VARPD|nr:hypothetical protein [Variovorax paradoxus]QGW80996.1 hypothetical protein GOQ09_05125 [Variovorax paradoxus]